jgi:hypothetical protein
VRPSKHTLIALGLLGQLGQVDSIFVTHFGGGNLYKAGRLWWAKYCGGRGEIDRISAETDDEGVLAFLVVRGERWGPVLEVKLEMREKGLTRRGSDNTRRDAVR